MNCLCPNCDRIVNVPEPYLDQNIKCEFCKKPFLAKSETRTIESNPQKGKHERYILYAVIFVAVGLILCFLSFSILTKVIKPAPFSFSQTQKDLVKRRLFLLQPAGEKEIFQGRWLNKFEFAEDAILRDPILILWLDDFNDLAGIHAIYQGNRWGDAADSNEDKWQSHLENAAVSEGFEQLTKANITRIIGEHKFTKEHSDERLRIDQGKWRLLIRKSGPLRLTPSDFHKTICSIQQATYEPNAISCDVGIYSFSILAINF